MKKIIIQKLVITNFKGIKNQTIDFNSTTNIYGANGSGKTSIFDAFTWLLFGKDSADRKDFDIKPLDNNGNVIQKIENEVEGTLLCNGDTIILKRIHREKWVKKKGSLEAEFTGNETVYFWNDVPMNAKEYTSKINDLLDETIFKLISNPFAFNNLKWQDRRKVLIDIAGEIKVDYIGNGLSNVLQLIEKKTISELKSETNAKVKKIKEELKQIPTRIDEVVRSKPEVSQFEQAEKDLEIKESELKNIQSRINDSSVNNKALLDKKSDIQHEIYDIKNKISEIEFELETQAKNATKVDTSKVDALKQKLSNQQFEFNSCNARLKRIEQDIDSSNVRIDNLTTQMDNKRKEWHDLNAKTLTFNENDFHCPACKREFEEIDVEAKKLEMTTNFNASKQSSLSYIQQQGASLKKEHEQISFTLSDLLNQGFNEKEYAKKVKSEIDLIQKEINQEIENQSNSKPKTFEQVFTELHSANEAYNNLKDILSQKETELQQIVIPTNEELEQEAVQVQNEIKNLNNLLAGKKQIEIADNRIKELNQEESSLSTSLLELEKLEFDIDKYIKISITVLEDSINNKFEFVKFKMFETQINGGEIECCNALIDGVPFHSANTASKVNAGIDIINALCEFYMVYAPIFIDNRESVTELIDTQSQVVSLIVSPQDKTLRIS